MASPNLKKRVIDLLSKGFAVTGYRGLPDLALDSALVDDIFVEANYSASERTALATWFGNHPVKVKGEYPRSPKELPCVIVQRIKDGESSAGPMGDHFGPDLDADTASDATFVFGVRATEQIQLQVWAYNSTDMRDALYLAVRELLLRGRAYLEDAVSGIDMVLFTSGKDGQFDRGGDKPMIVHTAELLLDAQTRTTWRETSTKATSCTGQSTYNEWQDEA